MNDRKEIARLTDSHDYGHWLNDLKKRYHSARLRASLSVTKEVLLFYWSIGRDIASKQWANTYGSAFYKTLSRDMRREIPDVEGFSETNLKYMARFYLLYNQIIVNHPRIVDDFSTSNRPQPADEFKASNSPFLESTTSISNHPQDVEEYCVQNLPQSVEDCSRQKHLRSVEDFTLDVLCSIPWFHHRTIIDKCKDDVDKAIFYVRKTIENNWGRNMLLNYLDTNLYEREGKAVSNFHATLPALQSNLAQQITRDPYNFDFLTLTEGYVEKELEDALVNNITRFLLELGAGWAYMGRQLRFGVGEKEVFPDLLFYNTRIHAYCVVELKTGSFKADYLGQLSLYVATINHQMKSEQDNPTIGLLICKDKDNVMAQYSLENISAPIGISEYQLSQIYPADFKSSLPSIAEIEHEMMRAIESVANSDK